MNENGTSVQMAGADHDLDELESRVKSFNRGDRAAPQKESAPAKESGSGFAGYLRQSLRSKIVQYGAVAIMAFGVGAYTSDNFKQSAKAAGKAAKDCIGYCVGTMFNALPKEQRYNILRDNVRNMPPKELMQELEKSDSQRKPLSEQLKALDHKLVETQEKYIPGLKELNDGILKLYGAKRPENAQEKK